MSNNREAAIEYAHEHKQQFLDDLIQLSSIPSISANPDSKADMLRAAEWIAKRMRSLGIDNVKIYQTEGHPVVYGETLKAGSDVPTALVYGHYDVQPPDPLELWKTGPFEPTVRGENIYARGVTDMKGQVMVFLDAIEAITRTGTLPVNLKFLIEGEEEIGSPSLDAFVEQHKEMLSCDFAINPDTGVVSPDLPTITYALRGLAYFEIRIQGPDHDLHSGTFGGVVHNPAQVLCDLIAGMKDKNGRITLPGFYDQVRPLSEEERQELARLPLREDFYKKATGAPAFFGEAGYSLVERAGARPTLDVNGIQSGYTGPGSKTVLPSKAMAKVSMRLVPDQDPKEIHKSLKTYLEQNTPETVTWELIAMAGGPASISDRNSPYVQALSQAMESVWGKRPIFKREGGSVPVVSLFQNELKVESVNTGFAMPDDNMHSPNEKMHLPTWYRGIDTFINFFYNLKDVH